MPTPRRTKVLARRLLLASLVTLGVAVAAAVVSKSLEGRASTPRCAPAKAPVPVNQAAPCFATDTTITKKKPACPRPAGGRPKPVAQ
jgi:hypothetical protein